jgi:hypothetical protein
MGRPQPRLIFTPSFFEPATKPDSEKTFTVKKKKKNLLFYFLLLKAFFFLSKLSSRCPPLPSPFFLLFYFLPLHGAHPRGGQIIRLPTAYRTAIDRLPTLTD